MGGDAAQPVTVVGAGVFGLTTALAMAQGGRRVRVVAETPPAATASGVAAGMLAPAFETLLDPAATDALALMCAARDLWPGLATELGVALDRSGAAAAGPADWIAGLEAAFTAQGLRVFAAGRPEIETWAQGVQPAWRTGLVSPEDWRVEPALVLAGLVARLAEWGVRVGRRRLTAEDLEALPGPIVLATGADPSLASLAPELALLTPIKGQLLHRGDLRPPTRVIRTEGAYVLGSQGAFLAGATMEPGRRDLAPDREAQAGLRARLGVLFPDLPEAGWRTRTGVRAASPDGLPLAGASVRPGVFLATGARRNGWLLAPLVAGIVSAAVNGEDAGPWAGRLDPRRFPVRANGGAA